MPRTALASFDVINTTPTTIRMPLARHLHRLASPDEALLEGYGGVFAPTR
jgi:hypothetical protein